MEHSKDIFIPIIGLEIHVEPTTKSKMFCACDAQHFQIKPNTHTCPVCLGLPGALPVPNQNAIEACIKLGLALNCKINEFSKFDRKNYFYPDLPKAYQISQYDIPFCYKGNFTFPLPNETTKIRNFETTTIHITRVHMEEDTGKLIHVKTAESPLFTKEGARGSFTLVDYNRSGVPLIEIVTEPELHSSTDAKQFLKELTRLIRWLDISDCDMEKGSMRLEANVSVTELPKAESPLFTKEGARGNFTLPSYKVELKNINSFRYLEKAIEIEISRQTEILKKGQTPKQETRGYNENKDTTFSQRSKEAAQDYRYFPEPDIPPLQFTKVQIKSIQDQINILPFTAAQQLTSEYKIRPDYAELLTDDLANYRKFLEVINQLPSDITPAETAQQIINQKLDLAKLSPKQIITTLQQSQTKYSLKETEIAKIVTQILKDNPNAVADYQSGKTNVIGFLTGQVMKQTKGQANPKIVKRVLKKYT